MVPLPSAGRPGRPTDNRHFPRRAKSIRFRFESGGDQHRAVSTVVSVAGAFLKASHVLRPGTLVTLVERFNPDGVELVLRAEVVWTVDEPTLDRPDSGFGVRFIEVATRADPSHVEEFLRTLDPSLRYPEVVFEERANGAHAVYRFPRGTIDPERFKDDEPGFANLEEPAVVDLAGELARLARVATREDSAHAPEPSAGAAAEAVDGPVVAEDEGSLAFELRFAAMPSKGFESLDDAADPMLAATSEASASASPVPATTVPATTVPATPVTTPSPRPRKRTRSVTGIFTALFSRASKDSEATDEQRAANSRERAQVVFESEGSRSAALGVGSEGSRSAAFRAESRLPRVLIVWAKATAVARVESFGRSQVTVWAEDAPMVGEDVLLKPVGVPPALEFTVAARVVNREDQESGGVSWLSLQVLRVEEYGYAGRFAEYLRLLDEQMNDVS